MIKENYLNILITTALVSYVYSIFTDNTINALFIGFAYGICFGFFIFLLKKLFNLYLKK